MIYVPSDDYRYATRRGDAGGATTGPAHLPEYQ